MKNVLVIGATSGIARAMSDRLAREGARLFLVGRSAPRLEDLRSHLKTLGAAEVGIAAADLVDKAACRQAIESGIEALGKIDLAVFAQGVLGDNSIATREPDAGLQLIDVNYSSVVHGLILVANQLRAQRSGSLAILGSVAGDRSRKSLYAYGATKAALAFYATGLSAELEPHGVHVCLIKPGPIDTPMTRHLKRGLLMASADTAARLILVAIEKKRNVAYVPGFWRVILAVFRLIPESLFRRLPL